MKTALNQLIKRKQIYIQELSKLTSASEYELSNLSNLSSERLQEIIKAERYEARIEVAQTCIDLIRSEIKE